MAVSKCKVSNELFDDGDDEFRFQLSKDVTPTNDDESLSPFTQAAKKGEDYIFSKDEANES